MTESSNVPDDNCLCVGGLLNGRIVSIKESVITYRVPTMFRDGKIMDDKDHLELDNLDGVEMGYIEYTKHYYKLHTGKRIPFLLYSEFNKIDRTEIMNHIAEALWEMWVSSGK